MKCALGKASPVSRDTTCFKLLHASLCADEHARDQQDEWHREEDQANDPSPVIQTDAEVLQHLLQQPPAHEVAPASPSLYVEYQSGGRANVANDLVVYETLIEDDGAPHLHPHFQGLPFLPESQGPALQSDAAFGDAADSTGSIQGWTRPDTAVLRPPAAPVDLDPTQDPALDPTQDPALDSTQDPGAMPLEESLASPSYSPPPETADPDHVPRALGMDAAVIESGEGAALPSDEGKSALLLQSHWPPRQPQPSPQQQQQHGLAPPRLPWSPQRREPPPLPPLQQHSGGGAPTFSSMDDSERDYAAVDLAEAALRSRGTAVPAAFATAAPVWTVGPAPTAPGFAAAAVVVSPGWTAAPEGAGTGPALALPPSWGASALSHWGPGAAAAAAPHPAPQAPVPLPPPAQGAGTFEYFPSLPTQVGDPCLLLLRRRPHCPSPHTCSQLQWVLPSLPTQVGDPPLQWDS